MPLEIPTSKSRNPLSGVTWLQPLNIVATRTSLLIILHDSLNSADQHYPCTGKVQVKQSTS